MRTLLLLLLFPTLAMAECAQWWVCPYVSPANEPSMRYVSLVDLQLPFQWQEIEVDGNRAVVCLSQPMPPGPTAGCTTAGRTEMRALLQPPKVPYFDDTDQTIKFREERRGFNTRALKERINDSGLAGDILEQRSGGR